MTYKVTLGRYPIGLNPKLTGPVPSTVRAVELSTDAGFGRDIWKGYCDMRKAKGDTVVGWPPYTTISLTEDAPEIRQFEEAINLFMRFLADSGHDTYDRVVEIELMSENTKFVIEKIGDTVIRVSPVRPSQVTSMQSTPDGGMAVKTLPVREVIPGYLDDVFTATYAGDNKWDTDVNCGAQRWYATKSTREIRAALRKCYFDKSTIDQTIKEVKAAYKKQAAQDS